MDRMVPWGLSRMQPYPTLVKPTTRVVGLDPQTQTAIYEDTAGQRLEMGRHSTHRGVETETQTSPGDGAGPDMSDQDHDQRTEQDETEESS
ncbi:putative ATP-grasp-modified RiPP [Streptomyces yaizuensis]|uniref:ATP-grasp-modified RiPP n=1 Tax=Streptomyces yaizuensis TaxID=2989713 RepID=A0ABQ5NXQ5_9ACTN|nr:putative ATP-grasp-modified RiPP [Streptomyces sp. YSPA8]GLF94943.1 putative ATP-grasp-modified RiPP [Streptomyces sp. YSPA8]